MEHPEQLVNKALLILFVLLIGCKSDKNLIIHESSDELNTFNIKATYKGNVFSGFVYNTNSYGDTISLGRYKNGLRHGTWKKFHSNGQLREKRVFKKGLKVDLYEGFYSDGSKNFVFMFKNGEYNGTNRIWTKVGQIIEELNFENGQQVGSQKVWYIDGKIKSNYIIKNNRRYGLLGTKNCRNVSEEIFEM